MLRAALGLPRDHGAPHHALGSHLASLSLSLDLFLGLDMLAWEGEWDGAW